MKRPPPSRPVVTAALSPPVLCREQGLQLGQSIVSKSQVCRWISNPGSPVQRR